MYGGALGQHRICLCRGSVRRHCPLLRKLWTLRRAAPESARLRAQRGTARRGRGQAPTQQTLVRRPRQGGSRGRGACRHSVTDGHLTRFSLTVTSAIRLLSATKVTFQLERVVVSGGSLTPRPKNTVQVAWAAIQRWSESGLAANTAAAAATTGQNLDRPSVESGRSQAAGTCCGQGVDCVNCARDLSRSGARLAEKARRLEQRGPTRAPRQCFMDTPQSWCA